MLSNILLLYIIFISIYTYQTFKINEDAEFEKNLGSLLIAIFFNLFVLPYIILKMILEIKIK